MILEDILERTRFDLLVRRRHRPLRDVERDAADAPPPRGFAAAIAAAPGRLGLIAEIKRASPSAGVLRGDLRVGELARAYVQGGARAVSVLTETPHFQGEVTDLEVAGEAGVPLLQKDFIVEEYQILEGRASGADAVLLIAEALATERASQLCDLALQLGLDVLYEAHAPANVRRVAERAERDPTRVLAGINNRDLRTFEVRLETSLSLLRELPQGLLYVSESGIKTPADVVQLRDAGARAILVGETLLRAQDPGVAARSLLSQLQSGETRA